MSLRRRRSPQDRDERERNEVRIVDDLDDETVTSALGRRRVGGAADETAPSEARGASVTETAGAGGAPRAETASVPADGPGTGTVAGAGAARRFRTAAGPRAPRTTAGAAIAAGTASDAASSDKRRDKKPLYPRLLRLRHVQPNAWQRAALGEGAIGVGVLLAMADLATAWAIVVLPVAVAAIVKAHDALQGLLDPRDDRPADRHADEPDDPRGDSPAPPAG